MDFVKKAEKNLNDLLKKHGELNLNDVYDELGFDQDSDFDDSDFKWQYTSSVTDTEYEEKKHSSYIFHLESRLKEETLKKERALVKVNDLLARNSFLLGKCSERRMKILSQEKHIANLEKQIRYLRRQVRVKDQELAEMDEKLNRDENEVWPDYIAIHDGDIMVNAPYIESLEEKVAELESRCSNEC